MKTPLSILQTYWKHVAFRPMQEEIIQSVLEAKDTLVVLPTGGGKSLCYQIPTLVQGGKCLVVSPLIALMKDQVARLEQLGISAVALHAGLSKQETQDALYALESDNIRFIYLSPERLNSSFVTDHIQAWDIRLLAVDEAHCISQWGYDFRPAYLEIATIRAYLPTVPVIALTGSATKLVLQDIEDKLKMNKPSSYFQSFERPNISLSVNNAPVKINRLIEIITKISDTTIVYCNNRKRCQEISETINARGFQSTYYHAGLNYSDKEFRMQRWMQGEVPIMVCTNAFGMGIDKANVRLVIHFDTPDTPESFYQEIGRAGRDGEKAWHVLLFHEHDLENLKQHIALKYPSTETIRAIYKGLCEYLQIPIGYGELESFPFQLGDFANKFSFAVFEVLGTLKILEQHKILYLTDAFHKPSKVLVTANKGAIHQLEKELPDLDEVLKIVLRTYPGIMQIETAINEFNMAQTIGVGQDYIVEMLQKLHLHGYISYTERNSQPELVMLQERMPEKLLPLNTALLKELKSRYEKRVLFMLSYCQNSSRCRSRYLLSYFEEYKEEDCGKCDRCLMKNKKNQIQKFDQYKTVILQAIHKNGSINPEEFANSFPLHEREPIMKTVRILMDEQILLLNTNGCLIRYAQN